MVKKQITPTSESIRKAYIQEFLKRKADAEAFANFTETELATFIRKYDSVNITSTTGYATRLQSIGKWLLLMRKQG